jgi:hypothetical protein
MIKTILGLSTCVMMLVLAAWSLRLTPEQVTACVENTRYDEARCIWELTR